MASRMYLNRIALGLVIAVLLGACAAKYKREEQALKQPINCATAEGDIRMLQHEKAHVLDRIEMGVTALAPAGIVVGAVSGTEGTKMQVATGEYNKKIDQKISEINATCGPQ